MRYLITSVIMMLVLWVFGWFMECEMIEVPDHKHDGDVSDPKVLVGLWSVSWLKYLITTTIMILVKEIIITPLYSTKYSWYYRGIDCSTIVRTISPNNDISSPKYKRLQKRNAGIFCPVYMECK